MKQLSVVPTAWIADQMEETTTAVLSCGGRKVYLKGNEVTVLSVVDAFAKPQVLSCGGRKV